MSLVEEKAWGGGKLVARLPRKGGPVPATHGITTENVRVGGSALETGRRNTLWWGVMWGKAFFGFGNEGTNTKYTNTR